MSPLRTGVAAQLGVGEETTYGTPVTPNRFFEFVSESLKLDLERLESRGLRAGTRVLRSDRWRTGRRSVSGDIELEVNSKSQGLLWKHMLGSIATTTPSGATNTRDHTATPGDLPVGLTVQVGRPDVGGTVRPFTYHGCKIATWALRASVGEIGLLRLGVVGEDEDTATSLASASYASGDELMTFVEGSLSIASSTVDVREVEITGDNMLAADRHRLGSGLIREPVEADMRRYGGRIVAFFPDLTAYNRFVTGTEASLELLFQGSQIEAGFNYETKVTMNVRFDGETPNVSGPDELDQPLPFVAVDSGSGPASAITVVYRTDDTTP